MAAAVPSELSRRVFGTPDPLPPLQRPGEEGRAEGAVVAMRDQGTGIVPGAGGAPLLNMQGEVVGIVISSLDGGAFCFAVPIEAAEKIHRDYVRFGVARPGRLGVVVCAAANAAKGSSAEVDGLEGDSPACKAGMQKGDIVLRIGEVPVKDPEDVLNAGFYLTAGERVPVTVWRKDQEIVFQVEPAGAVDAGSRRNGAMHASIPIGTEDITLRLP